MAIDDDHHGQHDLWRRVNGSDPQAMLELVRRHIAGANIMPEDPGHGRYHALHLCDRLRDVLHGMLLVRPTSDECRPMLGGETGEDACVAPTASAEADPTDYEAAAAEALRDPVVRRAFEEHERARTEREERARCMATVTHTVRTIPPITSLLDEAEDEERRARERRSAAPTEPAWNRVRYAVDARPEPDHVIAALAAAARGSWIMDDADEGNTLRALVVKARQQWDDTRARLRSLEVGGRASQGQSPGGER